MVWDVQEAEDMSGAEAAVMAQLGWEAAGLIESAGKGLGTQQADATANGAPAAASPMDASPAKGSRKRRRRGPPSSDIRLLACDMDGTLLDSSSRVLPSTVEALKVRHLNRPGIHHAHPRSPHLSWCKAGGLWC
jgi:hypothetical protein